MSSRKALRRWASFAALVLCVGPSVGDAHVHLDAHEEAACTLCAISEAGHAPEVGWVDTQPSEWRWSDSLPLVSATLAPRPYEVVRSRAPPFPVS